MVEIELNSGYSKEFYIAIFCHITMIFKVHLPVVKFETIKRLPGPGGCVRQRGSEESGSNNPNPDGRGGRTFSNYLWS